MQRQIEAVRAGGRTYARALHLAPSNGGHWGDAAAALHLEAQLRRAHARVAGAPDLAQRLRGRAERLLRGAPLLAPVSGVQGNEPAVSWLHRLLR